MPFQQKLQEDINHSREMAVEIYGLDKVKGWEEAGEMDAFDAIADSRFKDIPFGGLADLTAQQAGVAFSDDSKIQLLVEKKKKGEEFTSEEQGFVDEYVEAMLEREVRGYSFGGKLSSGVLRSSSFFLELALAKGAIGKVGTSANLAGKTMKARALALATTKGGAKKLTAGTAFLGAASADTYLDRRLNDSVSFSDKGELLAKQSTESPASSALKAMAYEAVNVGSEFTGGALGKYIFNPIGRKIPVKSGLSRLPKPLKAQLFKAYKVLKPNAKVAEAFSGIGFNSMIEELGEEQVNRILTGFLSLAVEQNYSTKDFLNQLFPDVDDLLVEAGVIGVMGGVRGTTNLAANIFHQKGYSPEESVEMAQALSVLQQEQLIQVNGDKLENTSSAEELKELEELEDYTPEELAMAAGATVEEVLEMKNNPKMLLSRITSPKTTVEFAPKKDVMEIGSKEMGTAREVQGTTRPISAKEIVENVENVVGKRIYERSIRGSTLGTYTARGEGQGGVKVKLPNDVEVIIHEVGHYLDKGIDIGVSKDYKTDEIAAMAYAGAPDKVKYVEGFAEFFRAYMTQDSTAREAAPVFYKKFEQALSEDKPLQRKIHRLQDRMHQYMYQGVESHAVAATSGSEASVVQKLEDVRDIGLWNYGKGVAKNVWQEVTTTFDRVATVEDIQKDLTGKIDQNEGAVRWWRGNDSAYRDIETLLYNQTFTYDAGGNKESLGKPLVEIFKPLKNDADKQDKFAAYLVARRSVEKKAQGMEVPLSDLNIQTSLGFANQYQDFPAIAAEYQKFNKDLMQLWTSLGFLTKDQASEIMAQNLEYVPFYKYIEGTEEKSKIRGGGALGFMTGNNQEVDTVYNNIVRNVSAITQAAIMNKAKVETYKMLSSNIEGARIAAPLPKKVQVQVLEQMGENIDLTNEIMATFKENGLDVSAEEVKDILNSISFMMPRGSKIPVSPKGNLVDVVKINGEEKAYEINDPYYAKFIQSLYYPAFTDPITKTLSTPSRLVRSFTGADPVFITNMAIIDKVIAGITGRTTPVLDDVKTIMKAIEGHPLYKQAVLDLGLSVPSSPRVEGTVERKAKSKLLLNDPNVLEKGYNSYMEAVRSIYNSTRYSEYIKTLEDGGTRQEAIMSAKNVAVDFDRKSARRWMQWASQSIAFFHGTALGHYKLIEEFTKKKEAGGKYWDVDRKRMGKRMGLLIAMGMLYAWVNEDDEEYQKLSSFEKSQYWWDGDVKVRKPFAYGIFATLGEVVVDVIKNDNSTTEDEKMALMTAIINNLSMPRMPSLFGEMVFGENYFGKEMVSPYEEDQKSWTVTDINTPEMYRILGRESGASPRMLHMMSSGILGAMQKHIDHYTNKILWDEEAYGEMPDFGTEGFIGLIDNKPNARTKYADLYYDHLRPMVKEMDSTMTAVNNGAEKRLDKHFKEWKEKANIVFADKGGFNYIAGKAKGLGSAVRAIDKHMSQIKIMETRIARDKNLTGKQKADQINDLWEKKTVTFKAQYERFIQDAEDTRKEFQELN